MWQKKFKYPILPRSFSYNTTKCVKLNGEDYHVAQIKLNHLV